MRASVLAADTLPASPVLVLMALGILVAIAGHVVREPAGRGDRPGAGVPGHRADDPRRLRGLPGRRARPAPRRHVPLAVPYDHGMLDVGDGNLVYWETCGNPAGKPAVVLHGGPGSGCTPGLAALLRPRRVPDRPLRPARLRPQHAPRQRPAGRPGHQHDPPPARRHRAPAAAPGHRPVAALRRVVGLDAGAGLRRDAIPSASRRSSSSASSPRRAAKSSG